MLAWSEGTENGRQKTRNHGYDVIVGGELFTDYSDHPRKLVTLNPKLKSTAAGRYQLLSRWWDAYRTAMRRDGEIYASMVNDIYDVPRHVTLTLEDGSEKDVQLYAQVVDYQSGNVVTLNDIRGRYECYTDVGPSFQSMKEQNRAEIQELLTKVPQGTPEFQMLMLQYFTLLDGKGVEMMREYANKQLVMMGLNPPAVSADSGNP